MLLKATLIGKEETFRALGIQHSTEIELEKLITGLRKQLEEEYYDTENLGQEILEGLEAVRDGRVDRRHWREVMDEI
ncbi:hypothetical protein [Desulfonema magnum]|uniref:hypothetical protein n=1 Tax=Desulfonema magnum TaxID=45655 RepID=UPI001A9B220C|nr:hypothetical protein [Desulfonema magnum]